MTTVYAVWQQIHESYGRSYDDHIVAVYAVREEAEKHAATDKDYVVRKLPILQKFEPST